MNVLFYICYLIIIYYYLVVKLRNENIPEVFVVNVIIDFIVSYTIKAYCFHKI